MKMGWVALGLTAALMAGCGGDDELEMEARIDAKVRERSESLVRVTEALNQRISQVEQSNDELLEEVKKLRELTEKGVETRAAAAVESKVKDVVVTWLDEKGAGENAVKELVQEGFEQNFERSIQAYESKKAAEEEAQREQARQERDQRRQEYQERRVAEIAEELKLSDDQAVQLLQAETALREAMHVAFQTAHEQGIHDRDQIRESIQNIRTTHAAVVGEFLNEEQLKAYQEKQESRFGFGRGRGSRGGSSGGGGGGGSGGGGR